MIDIPDARWRLHAGKKPGQIGSDIEILFGVALDELEAARKTISEFNIFAEEKENSITIYYRIGDKTITRSAIIPNPGDAEILQSGINYVERRIMASPDDRGGETAELSHFDLLLHRYLAELEGKPCQ